MVSLLTTNTPTIHVRPRRQESNAQPLDQYLSHTKGIILCTFSYRLYCVMPVISPRLMKLAGLVNGGAYIRGKLTTRNDFRAAD